MANVVSAQQGAAPVVPAAQNLTFTPRAIGPGANAGIPSNQAQNNNGYQSIFLYVFSLVQKFWAPSLENPASGQIYPRGDGGTPTIFPE